MEIPHIIKSSLLWQRLSTRAEHTQAIADMRIVAEALGRQIERVLPDYTDHSLRHMDALWVVSDAVLTAAEVEQCTASEAFLLGCAFYAHDLGMALAATSAGAEVIRSTTEYQSAYGRLLSAFRLPRTRADALALRSATRDLHAQKARDLVTNSIPGLSRFLLDSTELREKWAPLLGDIAASHHWSLEEVHKRLGRRDAVPTADGDTADLGYLACILRIVDYAHINRERATHLDRILRSQISEDSILHWDAQANITGPKRLETQLIYGCTAALTDIEAWWLFYDLASGLDAEIRSVRDYLVGRKISASRFSLQGVRGVESPEAFSSIIQLDSEIAPIDVRVQPHSMERVVDLLGGAALYRGDQLAAIRELIQNCRDAIALRQAAEIVEHREPTAGKIDISVDFTIKPALLRIRDNGVGMTRSVVKNHLIAVASDFWRSAEFARDFGRVQSAGFCPIGKFGIGFLSIFMLGDYVEVETERAGSNQVLLRLRGLGRRGEIREKSATGRIGTEVRVRLHDSVAESLRLLPDIVRARAPMLPYPVTIQVKSDESPQNQTLDPRWWARTTDSELQQFVFDWEFIARKGRRPNDKEREERRYARYSPRSDQEQLYGWPGAKPDVIEDMGRLISCGGNIIPGVLRCSLGIAVGVHRVHDLLGIIDVGETTMSTARDSVLEEATTDRSITALYESLLPKVSKAVNELEAHGLIPARHSFLRFIAQTYGYQALSDSSLRWIPVLEPPGNLVHRSSSELRARISSESAIVVCSGAAPGAAYSLATSRVKSPELGRTLVVPFAFNEFKVSWDMEKRIEIEQGSTKIHGSLGKVLETAHIDEDKIVLLRLVLDTIAEGWQIKVDLLQEQHWELETDSLRGWLLAHLRRP